jgi:hypothetical protein
MNALALSDAMFLITPSPLGGRKTFSEPRYNSGFSTSPS